MNQLAVFARPPVPGEVKSRLSPAIPQDLAARLYGAMLSDAFEAAGAARADRVGVWWAPAARAGPPLPVPDGFTVHRQTGADLGERLAAAFDVLLAGGGGRAVVIGADCPELDPVTIRRAFAALDDHDLVVGPAADGGYYLIGLRRPAPALFRGVPWGTGEVLAETLARARLAGLRVRTLEPLGDVDTPDDLVRLLARWCVSAPGPGRHTESALREMGLLPPRA